jgi:hypothetical protein
MYITSSVLHHRFFVPELKVDKSVEKRGTRWEGEKSHNFKISSSKSIQGDKQEGSDKVDCGIYNIYKESELLKKITYRTKPPSCRSC